MAGAVIGALRVVLGADSAALTSDLDKARAKLAEFGASISKAGAIAGAAMVGVAATIGVGVKKTLDEMDGFSKASQKVGMSTEALSGLKYAADLSDVSMESLTKGLAKLSQNMVQAATKPTSEAALAFQALGLSVKNTDGTLKSSGQSLSDIAGKFEGAKDGAAKTAIAMALFGKAGADMIPLLNSGKQGLADMTAEAGHLGIIISSSTAKQAEAFNDNLTRLHAVTNGLFVQLTAQLLPSLQQFSEILVQTAKDGNTAKIAADLIGGSLLKITEIVMTVSTAWQRLGVEWTALRELLQTDVFSGKLTENWNKFNEAGKETQRVMATLHASFENDPLGNVNAALAALPAKADAGNKSLKDLNYSAMAGKNAFDAFIDSQKKSQAAQLAEIQTDGMAAGAKEKVRVGLQGLAVAQANHIVLSAQQKAALDAVALSAEQLALKIQGQQLISQNSAPMEVYRQELVNTTLAMQAAGATQDQLARNSERVAQQFGLSWQNIGGSIAGTAGAISQLASTFAAKNKAMGIASKAFGIAQAIINTQVAVTKAMATLPPPASYAAAAQAVAQGAASIATISAQKFAHGADFTIPGGIGGADKVPVSFMAQPGERVKVEPNKFGGDSSSDGMIQHITLHMEGALRPLAQAMIGQINSLARDGYRLQVAPA
jgi:hypothetical protein